MTLHTPNFFLKDLVPESCLEFPLPHRGSGDGHGFLSTSDQDLPKIRNEDTENKARTHVWFKWGDGSTIERGFGGVRFKGCECIEVMQLTEYNHLMSHSESQRWARTLAVLSLDDVMK